MRPDIALAEIQSDLREGKYSCVDLVNYYLKNIRANEDLNIFLEVFEQEALERAQKLDQKIAAGKTGQVFGLILGLKDILCYKDHKISASSKILADFVSLYSATAVERLLDEDAIMIGRTNCDEFAMGTSNENSAYGEVKNPIDKSLVPGGSSGGSAAAVKADMCLAALGTDTGGSVRQPASFCGVVGFKPTYGRVSRYGLIAYASSFDQIGTLTKNINDAAIINEVMAGPDDYDSTAFELDVPKYSENLSWEKPAKIGYLQTALDLEGINPEVKEYTEGLIQKLKDAGNQVDEVEIGHLEQVVPAYYVLTTAEASSNLARYDGVHYGYQSPDAKELDEIYKLSRSEGFGPEVQRRIMLGTFVLSEGYYDAYYGKAQKVRRLIQESTLSILAEYDFILLPTCPTPPFKIGEKVDDPIALYLQDIFTVQANLAGVPAISLPMGNTKAGLPFGMQLIGNKFEEEKLFAFSNLLMETIL